MRRRAAVTAAGAFALACAAPHGVDGQAVDPPPLFASHEPLAVTLTADLVLLDGDRKASPDRPALLTVAAPDGSPVDIEAEVRTRGAFRLDPANCSFPPLRIDVVARSARGTVFDGQDDLKLVSSCRPGREAYDQLVAIEYLAYRAYALLTDRSFRVRMLDLTFVDVNDARPPEVRPAFVIEEDQALAERHGAVVFDLEEGRNLPASAFDPATTTMTAVFEYMIGNTDWSEVAGHNVEILDRGGIALAVPYDFDFSGLANAPYATPDPDFGLRSVEERYYRGWCASPLTTRQVLERFRATRGEVLALFDGSPALAPATRERTRRYLLAFYDDIETDERAERRFLRDCRSVGP